MSSPANLLFIFLFLILTLAFHPASTGKDAPDLIYYNGKIITLDPDHPKAEAMAIKDGIIMLVAGSEEVLALKGEDTRLFDLHGLTILPGFNDAHCHWFSWREHRCTAHAEEVVEYPPLEEIMKDLSANGWTSISELAFGWPGDASIEHLNNALALEAAGDLSVRVNGYWGGITDVSMFDALTNYPPDRYYSDRIRAQGVKFYVDHPLGIEDILTQEEIDVLVQRAHRDGWQIATHAVNMSGVEKVLSAYEKVLGEEDNQKYRFRIEHAVKVNDDQMNRMLEKGIIASFQLMGPPDWPAQESHMNYISNTQPELQMRWREFVETGLTVVASTDAPFNNTTCAYNPFRVIYQGVTRIGYLDREHAQWELDQRLTIAQCLKLLTIDGAYATGEEALKGNLMAGKYADFIVVSDDPLQYEDSPEGLLELELLQTVVGGEIEYCSVNPCFDLCQDYQTFAFDSFRVSASIFLTDHPPLSAFDGIASSHWGAGAHPPQWIQVDLMTERPISTIHLTVSQFPEGPTVHQILGSRSDGNCTMELLREFSGSTRDGQVLTYTPQIPDTLRFFRILTTESPSWVSWYEVSWQYAGDMATPVREQIDLIDEVMITPNPVANNQILEVYSRQEVIRSIAIFSAGGQPVRLISETSRRTDHHRKQVSLAGMTPGVYFIHLITDNRIWLKKLILTH